MYISAMAEARVVKFCTQVAYIKSYTKEMTHHPHKGRGYGRMTH